MERKRPQCLNILMDCANLFKAFIGVNYLSVAFAISQSGLALGIIGLILIAVATVHGCHLLIKCKRQVIRNILDANLPSEDQLSDEGARTRRLLNNAMEKRITYGDVAFLTLGTLGTLLVNFSLIVTQFGFCVNYFIFLGNTFDQMFVRHRSLPYVDVSNASSPNVSTFDVLGFGAQDDAVVHNLTNSSTQILPDSFALASRSPGYNLLVLIPLPLFILFAYLRSIRHMGPVSVIANVSVFIGYFAMLSYLLIDFSVDSSVKWFKFSTFPIFFGSVTSSYEGIGTIIPIESSMDGSHHLFPLLLHLIIVLFTFILGSMGFIGYLRLGESTDQVLIWNLVSGSILQLLVSLVVCIGVIFTFPLMCFPIIQIFEELIFTRGRCCGPPLAEPLHVNSEEEEVGPDEEKYSDYSQSGGEMQHLLQDPQATRILEQLPVATRIPQSVSTWKRNVLRTLIVAAQLGCAYALKDQFAYFSALTGAIGSTLIAFIIPALLHLKLKRHELGIPIVIKDVLLMVFGLVGGSSGVYASILKMIENH